MPVSVKCTCGERHVVNQRLTHVLLIERYHNFELEHPILCWKCGTEIPLIFLPCEGDLITSLFGSNVQIGENGDDKT